MEPNVLTPEPQPVPQPKSSGELPPEMLDAGINLKNLEFLNYLGLKDEMLNSKVMEKVEFIGKYIPDLNELMKLDLKLGSPTFMPKLDKVFSYVKLLEVEADLQVKQDLINKQKKQWEVPVPPFQI